MAKVKVCPICGNEFTGRGKYCSDECRKEQDRLRKTPRTIKVCPICGTEFKGTSKDKYCSKECANTAHLSQMDSINRGRCTRGLKVMNSIHQISPDTQLGFGSGYEVIYTYGSKECESDIHSIESKWTKYAKMEEEIKSSRHH